MMCVLSLLVLGDSYCLIYRVLRKASDLGGSLRKQSCKYSQFFNLT